jgi:hypothetical protein
MEGAKSTEPLLDDCNWKAGPEGRVGFFAAQPIVVTSAQRKAWRDNWLLVLLICPRVVTNQDQAAVCYWTPMGWGKCHTE